MQLSSLVLIAALAVSPALAQQTDPGAKQDMKNAGHDTTHAVSSAGHGVAHGTETGYHKTVSGTKKGYHKTVHGTKKAYHKTAHATENGADHVEGKPATH